MNCASPRRRFWSLGLAALAAAACLPVQAAEQGWPKLRTASKPVQTETEARVIVKYKADSGLARILSASSAGTSSPVEPRHAQVLSLRLGIPMTDGAATGARSQVIRASGVSSADLAARLAAQGDVEYAVPDTRVHVLAAPNDPLYPPGQAASAPATGQWYLRKPGGDGEVSSINAEAAWAITTGKSSVVVAVIDTGITSHPDLNAKVLPGYDFISDIPSSGDGDGRDADPTDPGDGRATAADAAAAGCPQDGVDVSSWHGTQTAGLVGAATNNGIGIASIGRDVMVLPLRALGKCGGAGSDIQAAMRWAAGIDIAGIPTNTHPAKVINLSLGSSGTTCDTAYQDAVNDVVARGVVVVAAAGNDGLGVGLPANCTGVIAVAGVRHVGSKVGYSDLGPEVAISAPAGNCGTASGVCQFAMITTLNDGVYTIGNPIYSSGNIPAPFGTIGTSFASPLVAGTVALMFSANSSLTVAQVRSALTATARPFPTSGGDAGAPVCRAPSAVPQGSECYCTTSTCGAGLLDAGQAVAAVAVVTANISVASTSVTVGSSVTFDGTGSHASGTRSIVSYQWAITSGSSIASFTSATNAATATVATTGVGTFIVSLTVVDSVGQTDTKTSTITVSPAVPTPPTGTASDSGGGGGGASSLAWLFGLLVSAGLVRFVAPRRRV